MREDINASKIKSDYKALFNYFSVPMDGICLCSIEINETVSHINISGTKRTQLN